MRLGDEKGKEVQVRGCHADEAELCAQRGRLAGTFLPCWGPASCRRCGGGTLPSRLSFLPLPLGKVLRVRDLVL